MIPTSPSDRFEGFPAFLVAAGGEGRDGCRENAEQQRRGSKTDAITMIREVKTLAEKAGGYEKLKELVDALAE